MRSHLGFAPSTGLPLDGGSLARAGQSEPARHLAKYSGEHRTSQGYGSARYLRALPAQPRSGGRIAPALSDSALSLRASPPPVSLAQERLVVRHVGPKVAEPVQGA